jgi:hypothetical protein
VEEYKIFFLSAICTTGEQYHRKIKLRRISALNVFEKTALTWTWHILKIQLEIKKNCLQKKVDGIELNHLFSHFITV